MLPTAAQPKGRAALGAVIAAFCCLALPGCWGTVRTNLMPTPLVYQQIGCEIYADTAEDACSPVMDLFYATRRCSTGSTTSREYVNGSVDQLQMGITKIRRGKRSMSWDDLVQLSTSPDRGKKIPLRIVRTTELGQHLDDPNMLKSLNLALGDSSTHAVTIYIPGAVSSFHKSCAQATHLQHFMAANDVCIAYSWPSNGRFLGYGPDRVTAREEVSHLADLIEQLATSTNARRINVFSYSAGAQLAAPALALLRERHAGKSTAELRHRFRLGNAYFASPDISSRLFFTEYLPAFSEFVERTTFTLNRKDGFLKAAQWFLDKPRAGRALRDDTSKEELAWLQAAHRNPSIDVLDLAFSRRERAVNFRAHGTWYLNPWVSSDLAILLNHGFPARSRGLEEKRDGTGWFLPADYPDRLRKLGPNGLVPAIR